MVTVAGLGLVGGRLHVLIDGGAVPRPERLRAGVRITRRVAVMRLPEGHDSLDWLAPIAGQVRELSVFDHGCQDLSALELFAGLRTLSLIGRPHPTSPPLEQVAASVRRYGGPWFPGLDPVLASPALRTLMLERPPRDLPKRLTAPLGQLRLLSASKLAAVPVLSCTSNLTSLQIAGGKALDLAGTTAYPRLTSLDLYGRTPLTSFDALARCPELRRLILEKCYSVDDIDALRRMTLDELRVIGRPESLDPYLLDTARSIGVRRFSAPKAPTLQRPPG